MADQIRRRAARARAGVAMAVLALVGGAAGDGTTVAAAKTISWLNLKGFTGGVRNAFLKIENKILSTDSALASFEKKAERTYLTITDASKKYLKISDAALKYLKTDGTAVNSNALGGLTAGQFIQGHGGVITGSATFTGGTAQPLLGDGSVKVLIGLYQPQAGGSSVPMVTLENDSAQALSFTVSGAANTGGIIQPTGSIGVLATNGLPAVQFDIQLFQSGGSGTVRTLTVSSTPNGNAHTFVGQMLLGN